MAKINTKLIKYATQARFDIDIAKVPAIVDPKSIIFIEDTGRLYVHGKYFGGAWEDITDKPSTFAPSAHKHGSITNDGKIGTSADRIIETTTGGLLTHVAKNTAYNRAFGTGKNQVAMGNHTHDYLPLSGGKLTGNLEISASNTDKFIKFAYNTTDAYAWRIGYLGTGTGNENRLAFQSAKTSGTSYVDALSFGLDDLVGKFAVTPTVGNTKVSLEGHTHPNFTRTVAGLVPAPGATTITRYLREDGTWVTPPNTADTHWTTGIRAGASGTNANSVADNPFIKVLDNGNYKSQIQILGDTNITVKSDTTGKITIDGTHNHTLKLIAGASTATVNSTADVANPYIRLFSDNAHQGSVQIVGSTNVGAVSKSGVITLTATNTTYTTGTLTQLNVGNDTTGRLQTAKLLNDWLNPKLALKATPADISTAIAGLEIGGRNLIKNTDLNGIPYRYNHINKAGEGGLILSTLGFSEPIVQPQQYTISMEIRGVSDVNINIFRISPQGNSSIRLIRNTDLTEEYKKVELTFTPHRPQLTNLYVYTSYSSTAYNAWFEIKPNSIKLEKGNKPTDWTPAPEDQVSDWDTTDVNSFSFIKNKPTKLSEFSNNLGNYGNWITKAQGDTYYAPISHSNITGANTIHHTHGNWTNLNGINQALATTSSPTFKAVTLGTIYSTGDVSVLNGGSAQRILTGGLLASSAYADASKIPANGIYSRGKIDTLSHGDSSLWNTAYGWGNHADGGYVKKIGDTMSGSLTATSFVKSGVTAPQNYLLQADGGHILKSSFSGSTHNHALKLIAGASTATVNSAADVANPYIRLFSDTVHQGNIRIVGGSNVGAVSKNGVITLTATDTKYTAGSNITINSSNVIAGNYPSLTKANLDKGTSTTQSVATPQVLASWLSGKNYATVTDVSNKVDKIALLVGSTGANHYRRLTNVASLSGPSNSQTPIGDIVITLPIHTSTSWTAEIMVQQPNRDCKLIVSAYSTNNSGRKVTQLSGFDFISEVKFGRTSEGTVLILKRGPNASSFSYGRVNIDSFHHFVTYNVNLNDPNKYKIEFIPEEEIAGFTLNGVITQDNFIIDPKLNSAYTHISNKSNPHSVTKAQVGLGNVNNTSDANKPISTATQNALNLKFDKTGGRLTTGTGDVNIELWRGTNASWNILNSGGYLRFQSNYTTVVGAYFDALKLDYNTGNALFKGNVTAPTFTGALSGNASSATKVNNKLTLKFDTGTTENTNLYTYDGSAAKTIDIKAGSNVSFTKTANTVTIKATNTNTTYSAMSVAEGKAGSATSSRTVRADYLKQIIQHYDTNTTYTAGSGLTLSETQFSLPVTVSGSGTFVKSVAQDTDGIRVTLGTPPNTNTTYSAGTKDLIRAGSNTTNRVWSGKTLKDWYLEEIDILLGPDKFTGSTFSSNVIDLTNVYGAFNVNSANNYTTYTLSGSKVRGAWAKVLVNSSTPITIPGVKLINLGSNFEPNTNMYLNIMYDGVDTLGYYTKIVGAMGSSYYITTSSTEVIFANTPISNFSSSSWNIIINGASIDKDDIREIYFSNEYYSTTSIGNSFLGDCYSLTSVDLSSMINVTNIGHYFLNACTSLTSIDLSPMTKVTSIGDNFLFDAPLLTSIDLSSMTRVVSIGGYFLGECSSLTSIDLSSMINVTSIGEDFLVDCSSLTSVDLSSMVNVTSIRGGFLENSGVETLKMGAIVPPSLSYSLPSTLTSILVPYAAVNAYKTAPRWSSSASIISGY